MAATRSARHVQLLLCAGFVTAIGCGRSQSEPAATGGSYYITTDGQTWEVDLSNMRVYFPDLTHDRPQLSVYIASKLACGGGIYDSDLHGQSCIGSTSGKHAYSITVELADEELESMMGLGGGFQFDPESHVAYALGPDDDQLYYGAAAYSCEIDDCVEDEIGRVCYSDWVWTYFSQMELSPNEDLTWDLRFQGWLTPEAAAAAEGEPYVHGRVKLKDCTSCDVQEEWEVWQEHHTCYDYY